MPALEESIVESSSGSGKRALSNTLEDNSDSKSAATEELDAEEYLEQLEIHLVSSEPVYFFPAYRNLLRCYPHSVSSWASLGLSEALAVAEPNYMGLWRCNFPCDLGV